MEIIVNLELTGVFIEWMEEEKKAEQELFMPNTTIKFPFGILDTKLIYKDSLLTSQINRLIPKINNIDLQKQILKIEREIEKHNKARLGRDKSRENTIIDMKIKDIGQYLENLNFHNFSSRAYSIYKNAGLSELESTTFKIIELLYAYYKDTFRFEYFKGNSLELLYKNYNIDLNKVDSQYCKYQLLTIDDNFTILTNNIPMVFDKRVKSNILIKEINGHLLQYIFTLRAMGSINDLALRPNYNIVGKEIEKKELLTEAVEIGHCFSLDRLGVPDVTKLYSESYDNLWILIDSDSMSFEEILIEPLIGQDFIMTQLIHLKYSMNSDGFYINHIDHEYIFYAKEEYEVRRNNPKQKGNARKRYKTFKIDNSKIPIVSENGVFFMYRVLSAYFYEQDLLREYFAKILNNDQRSAL